MDLSKRVEFLEDELRLCYLRQSNLDLDKLSSILYPPEYTSCKNCRKVEQVEDIKRRLEEEKSAKSNLEEMFIGLGKELENAMHKLEENDEVDELKEKVEEMSAVIERMEARHESEKLYLESKYQMKIENLESQKEAFRSAFKRLRESYDGEWRSFLERLNIIQNKRNAEMENLSNRKSRVFCPNSPR